MSGRKRFLGKYDAQKRGWLRMAKLCLLLFVIIFLFFRFVIGYSFVSGVSMRETLQNGDLVFYTRINRVVERGSIIAVSLPSGERYVKRVVAVGGDTVDLRDGVLYVNDIPETGAYVRGETWPENGAFAYPLTVEEGDLFVLGDNREESIDSRFFGAISQRQISGVLRLRFSGIVPQLM